MFGRFGTLPPVVKNLLIINVLMFLGLLGMNSALGINLNDILGLHFFKSDFFQPYQVITHMFMHGSFGHLFFNMFMLWMFGQILERTWGGKKFFIFYFISGLGAVLVHTIVTYIQYVSLKADVPPDLLARVLSEGGEILRSGRNYSDPALSKLNIVINSVTVGASGALFGVITGFGLLFPNAQLMLLFPPIPIKGKYIAVLALVLGVVFDRQGNVAHFAHLGGMIFGYLVIQYWKRDNSRLI